MLPLLANRRGSINNLFRFSVNGFEKTSISDIAKEIGIAQGLCYRYFPSKDVLFQSAINEYSNILVANMTKNINIKKDSLKDILRKMILFAEQEDDTYYPVFHNNQNKNFHNLLTLNVCENFFLLYLKLLKEQITQMKYKSMMLKCMPVFAYMDN